MQDISDRKVNLRRSTEVELKVENLRISGKLVHFYPSFSQTNSLFSISKYLG
jgi:hypothetical protein